MKDLQPLSGVTKSHVTLAEALSAIPYGSGKAFATVMMHGSLEVEIYAPRGHDPQTPHSRDEVYVIMRGSGYFVHGSTREPFSTGDVLFVPAGAEHRFVEFSDDFITWVFFYGPEGGEK